MTKVLIADAIKPSLVMSSEVFKDKIPGSIVLVAHTGEDALRIAAEHKPDLCLVDFDLPDVDGPALIVALRKFFDGPILMTAYPDENVKKSVLDDLYAFDDASAWIKKPVRFDDLAKQIEQFLIERRRTGRRFKTDLPMRLIAKADGRGKRAPKAEGTLLNLSLGGACIQLTSSFKMKKNQEFTLTVTLQRQAASKKSAKARKSASAKPLASKASKPLANKADAANKSLETKIKAMVAWTTKEGQVGLQFSKLSDIQQRELETFLRSEAHYHAS